MSDRPWRCFVAVPIDDRLRAALATAVAAWRARPECGDLRWTDADAWHLTLAFLGATDPGRVDEIRAALARGAAGSRPFAVSTGGVGAFPSRGRARIAWYGVRDAEGRLAGLASTVRRELDMALDSRPFRPHLTLARVRGERTADLRGWVTAAADEAPTGAVQVDELRLMRSHLGRGPARYESLASVALGAGESVHV